MCGITGIWNFDNKSVDNRDIECFTNSLAHRGPDGAGLYNNKSFGIALGHRRLKIIDVSEGGRQPMSYAQGRYWITYNGEIYNFIELREELKQKGHRFQSDSDTEVILAAYEQWGEDMLLRFNGMWAFAIFDCKEKSLFISRDRFGIKPFYYRLTEKQFSFASELKAFKYLQGYSPEIDRNNAKILLSDGFNLEGTQYSLLKDVSRLQGGHCGFLKNGKLTVKRWWNTLEHLTEVPQTIQDQSEQFQELFYDSIKLRMRSDVPIGTCMSGGFDSSSIVCALSELGRGNNLRQAQNWQQSFIATFPGKSIDESDEAREVVRFAQVRGHFFPINETEALKDIDKILYDFDDIYIGIPTAPWLIYRELRNNNTVVSLDGHGADELMGMYAQADYLNFHDAPPLLTSPIENFKKIQNYKKLLKRFSSDGREGIGSQSAARSFFAYHPDIIYIKKIIRKYFIPQNDEKIKTENNFIRNNFHFTNINSDSIYMPVGYNDVLPDHWGPINRTLYRMFHSNTLPTILRNFDRLSMAHGIEVRMPFMDWRLVVYVFSLPDSSKIGDGMNKRIARLAMKGRMPDSIRTSKYKIGFNAPMPEWLRGPLKTWINNLLYNKDLEKHDIINSENFSSYINSRMIKNDWTWRNCAQPWLILNYLWFERNFLKNE